MVGMLQIITYMLAFYFILKGVEILQIALASSRENRKTMFFIAGCTIAACVIAAFAFIGMQDSQAMSVGNSMPSY